MSNGHQRAFLATDLMIKDRWTHFTVTWHPKYDLLVYIDGCKWIGSSLYSTEESAILTLPLTIAKYIYLDSQQKTYADFSLDEFYFYENVKSPSFVKLLESGFGLHENVG